MTIGYIVQGNSGALSIGRCRKSHPLILLYGTPVYVFKTRRRAELAIRRTAQYAKLWGYKWDSDRLFITRLAREMEKK